MKKDSPTQPESSAAPAGSEPASEGGGPARSDAPAQVAAQPEVDWKDRFLRSKADFANLQRRSADELASALRYANGDFARGMIEIADDFQRTLQAAPDTGREELLTGIRLIHDKLLKFFKDQQIEPIPALGMPFDPKLHQALLQQPSAVHKPDTVIQEIQTGYRLHDRILRPARVVIAKEPETGQAETDRHGQE